MCVCACVCVCVCLRHGREGQGSREQQVASATWRGQDGDALSAACAAASPPAAPRRISGALSEPGCTAQPAEHAPDESRAPRAHRRRRGRRADARVEVVGRAGEARRPRRPPQAVAARGFWGGYQHRKIAENSRPTIVRCSVVAREHCRATLTLHARATSTNAGSAHRRLAAGSSRWASMPRAQQHAAERGRVARRHGPEPWRIANRGQAALLRAGKAHPP